MSDETKMVLALERDGDICSNGSIKAFTQMMKKEAERIDVHVVSDEVASDSDNLFYRLVSTQSICSFNAKNGTLMFLAKRDNDRVYRNDVTEEEKETSTDFFNQTCVDFGGALEESDLAVFTNKIEGTKGESILEMTPVDYSQTVKAYADSTLKGLHPDIPDLVEFINPGNTFSFGFFVDPKVNDIAKTSFYLGRMILVPEEVFHKFLDKPDQDGFRYDFVSINVAKIFEDMDMSRSVNRLSDSLYYSKEWKGLDILSHHLICTGVQIILEDLFKDLTYSDCYDLVSSKNKDDVTKPVESSNVAEEELEEELFEAMDDEPDREKSNS